mgnify:FL=1
MDLAPTERLRSLDVVRGISLFGVIALNYHAVLNEQSAFAPLSPSFFDRLFNPISGVLTTRFAATFVFVAGIGVTLMASKVNFNDRPGMHRLRLTLLRRGTFLFVVGYGLEWLWPGTILFYYGAYFVMASFLVSRSTRSLTFLAIASVVAAAALNLWRVSERFADNYTAWLDPESPDSPRNVVIRLLVGYTHPVLPWIAFFIAGMIVARAAAGQSLISGRLAILAIGAVAGSSVIRDLVRPALIVDRSAAMRASAVSLQPFDRGALYVVSTLGVAILAVWSVEHLVGRIRSSILLTALERVGRMSLSLYLAHILIFRLVVDTLKLIHPTGLDTALVLSLAVYLGGLIVAWVILQYRTHGPMEWIYRKVGGR